MYTRIHGISETNIESHSSREKVLKLDARAREYDIIVIGDEPHFAYNRVGLTSFFNHRKVENLYLNPQEWVRNAKTTSPSALITRYIFIQ